MRFFCDTAGVPHLLFLIVVLSATLAAGCSPEPDGVAPSKPANTVVKMDFFHKPLPDLPLPNDVATRYDASSPTKRRINASMVAPTRFESRTRELIDQLDGWGVLQPISIPFTGPLDIASVRAAHSDHDYNLTDDVIYLIDVDRDSPDFGKLHHLDVGNGNYPVVLEKRDNYWPADPRGGSISLTFEESNEDSNGNGVLDPAQMDGDVVVVPPEDTDADGQLDSPNYLPLELLPGGVLPAADDLAGRADALMTFYERATHTLLLRPLVPLRDRTTYAVVVTRRLLDAQGQSVGSPYPFINHNSQTQALEPLSEVLPQGLGMGDVAFAFTFTTQSIVAEWEAVRDGLYGHGIQGHIGEAFPPKVDELLPLRDDASLKRPHLLPGEVWREVLDGDIGTQFLGVVPGTASYEMFVGGAQYIDYLVIGSFQAPQLFDRSDRAEPGSSEWMGYHEQVWPTDMSVKPVPVPRSETIYFTLAIPRKEVSPWRQRGEPVPIAITGHGYTSQRFEGMQHSSYLTRGGLAMLAIDGPSAGIGLSAQDATGARLVLAGQGLRGLADAILLDRAHDQNRDEIKDSQADFFSAYLFHTRDSLRQFALDYMSLIRLVRSFDGKRTWEHDTNGDGQPDLAGDFDGDGVIEIGAGSTIGMLGSSLGGIMSTLLSNLEPDVDVVAPIAGGGGLSDIGLRSQQPGIPEAFILRIMGPIFVGTPDPDLPGATKLETIIPDLNSTSSVRIGSVTGLKAWDTLILENTSSGEQDCAYVGEDLTVRTTVESNLGDGIRMSFYSGPRLLPEEGCQLQADAPAPYAVVDSFESDVSFQGATAPAGSRLVTLAEGLGLKRCTPALRRMQGLGQLVVDPSDPASLAPYRSIDRITYPGTGQTTGAHALIVSTMGDMNVPVSAGIAIGRSAGLIEYLVDDPRYGKPVNQVLIEEYVGEAVHSLARYTYGGDPAADGVHSDVENFSQGTDMWGTSIPRLEKPLHIGLDREDALGGISGAIFPYTVPEGGHGFHRPGVMTDMARERCANSCTATGIPDSHCACIADPDGKQVCNCDTLETFDIGNFMFNMLNRYLSSGGKVLDAKDLCQSRNDCGWISPPPPVRDLVDRP